MTDVKRDYWTPNYEGGGFLNLITSLGEICGARHSRYAPLSGIDTSEWARARNLLFILVDGLGADYIATKGRDGFLHRHQVATLTSVCPSTTAAAIPTAMTGLAPAEHALTGWHVFITELDSITAVLPLTARGLPFPPGTNLQPENIYGHDSFYQQLQRPCRVFTPIKLADTSFSLFHSRGAERHPYHTVPFPWIANMQFWRRRQDFFGILRRQCNEPGPTNFMYAYWPYFDSAAHDQGIAGEAALVGFRQFERDLEDFLRFIQGTDTTVVLSSDHGFIDSPTARQIDLHTHPELRKMLVRALCGERRFAYCYVRPDARRDFEQYIASNFAEAMEAWPRDKLLDERWLGPGPINARLPDRLGDYVLAMKDDWTIRDHVHGEHPIDLIGVHGGLSNTEMHIPLCVMHA